MELKKPVIRLMAGIGIMKIVTNNYTNGITKKAFVTNSTNKYEGDTYNLDNGTAALRAAFTAHRDIIITKNWNDANNGYNTRPDEKITFTLKKDGQTVKLTDYYGNVVDASTEMSWDEKTAIIGPLAPNFNITDCEIVESPPIDGYVSVQSSGASFTPDTYTDAEGKVPGTGLQVHIRLNLQIHGTLGLRFIISGMMQIIAIILGRMNGYFS